MDDLRDDLRSVLRTLLGVPCAYTLATNSIKLRFGPSPDPRGRAYLWIDPPWRLTASDVVVTGSMDWPVWDGVADPEVNRPLWEEWCALFSPLGEITDVRVGRVYPDLTLQFSSGHQIETFGNTTSDYWWYYRNRVTGEVYEAGAFGVRRDWDQPADVS
jgi:hypothetical protein